MDVASFDLAAAGITRSFTPDTHSNNSCGRSSPPHKRHQTRHVSSSIVVRPQAKPHARTAAMLNQDDPHDACPEATRQLLPSSPTNMSELIFDESQTQHHHYGSCLNDTNNMLLMLPAEVLRERLLPFLDDSDLDALCKADSRLSAVVASLGPRRQAWKGFPAIMSSWSPTLIVTFLGLSMSCKLSLRDQLALLHRACQHGQIRVAEAVVARFGLRLEDEDDQALTAVAHAASNGHLPMLKWLDSKFRLRTRDFTILGGYVIRSLCERGHTAVLEWLLSDKFKITARDIRQDKCACLRAACANGHVSIARMLVAHFQLTACDARSLNNAALREACANGHAAMVEYMFEQFKLGEDDLLDGNAGPLRWAVSHRRTGVLRVLASKFGIQRVRQLIAFNVHMSPNTAKPVTKKRVIANFSALPRQQTFGIMSF